MSICSAHQIYRAGCRLCNISLELPTAKEMRERTERIIREVDQAHKDAANSKLTFP